MIGEYFRLTRMTEWVTHFFPILVGFVFALWEKGIDDFYMMPLLMNLFISFLFFQAAAFSMNECFDSECDKLKKNNKNVISKGRISKADGMAFSVALGVTGIAFSYLFLPGPAFIALAAVYSTLVLYSSPPFRFKERFPAGIIAHGIWGSVYFVAGYAALMPFSQAALMLSSIFFLLFAVVSIMQEIRDYDADRSAGFSTAPVSLGLGKSMAAVKILFVLSLSVFAALVYLHMPIYSMLLLLSVVPFAKAVFIDKYDKERFFDSVISSGNKGIAIGIAVAIILFPLWFHLI